jgi:ribosomal protein S18 acetylase RimI-like enzyme
MRFAISSVILKQSVMIRPIEPSDTPALVVMAAGTDAFKPIELQALQEVLDDYHAQNAAAGHRAVALEADDAVVGFAYFAESAMTDRTWSLWWIVVDRAVQARGIGGEVLRYVEANVRAAAGRQLLIETSSLPKYELTRRFYLKYGYSQIAAVKDFYADNDDMLYFCKRMD